MDFSGSTDSLTNSLSSVNSGPRADIPIFSATLSMNLLENIMPLTGDPSCWMKLSSRMRSLLSLGSSYCSLSLVVILHSALSMAMLNLFLMLMGSPLVLSRKADRSATSSSAISSVLFLPKPRSLRACRENLLCSCQVYPLLRMTPGNFSMLGGSTLPLFCDWYSTKRRPISSSLAPASWMSS